MMKAATTRPTCRARRVQELATFRRTADGKLEKIMVRKPAPCGMLLDKTGKCWFCGHVDRGLRRQWREAAHS